VNDYLSSCQSKESCINEPAFPFSTAIKEDKYNLFFYSTTPNILYVSGDLFAVLNSVWLVIAALNLAHAWLFSIRRTNFINPSTHG
jgi:hypothetical protein